MLFRSEHDLALAMVVMAASSYAKIPLQGDALAVLRGVAGAEVRIKSWLASGGYFDFTAFDTPDHDAITANPTLP